MTTDADMAAFGASDAACVKYPGAEQAPERAAYCEGAAWAASEINRLRAIVRGYLSDCTNEECERCIAARAALAKH